MFFIWDKKLNYQLYQMFDTRDEAAKFVDDWLQGSPGYTHADLPIKERDDSPECMEARLLLSDGTYKNPVWFGASWYVERFEDIKTFAHVDPENPEMILFFENREKLSKGRTTAIKPGKFLKKFFSDVLSEDDILKWTDKHKEQYVDVAGLSWARTPEEISAVYQMDATFGSCMQHKMTPVPGRNYNTGGWPLDLPVHPTAVYGAGDLSLAYLHKGNRLLGRALVWEEKGLVGRVYGDIVGIRSALKKYGISTDSDQYNYDTFEGARLLKVEYPWPEPDNDNGHIFRGQPRVVAPYIDGKVDGLAPSDCGEYFIITDQQYADEDGYNPANPTDFKATEPGGYVLGSCKCAKCGKSKRHFYNLYSKDSAGEQVEIWWCERCWEDLAHYSDSGHMRYDREYYTPRRVYVWGHWGESTRWAVEGVDLIVETAEENAIWRRKQDCVDVVGLGWIGNHVIGNHAFKSHADNRWYPLDKKVVVGTHYTLIQEQVADFVIPPNDIYSYINRLQFATAPVIKRPESLFPQWL